MAIFFRLQEASWELWRWMGSDWGDRVWSLMGGQHRQRKEDVGVSDHLVVVVDSERERKNPSGTAVECCGLFKRSSSFGPARYTRKNYTILMSRLMIMALLATIVGVMALLTWYFTQMYFVDSVNTISLQLRQQMLQTSKSHFQTLIHNSVMAAQCILSHVSQRPGKLSATQALSLVAPVSFGLLSLFPNLTVTGYVSADGPFMVYGRSTPVSKTQVWYSNVSYNAASTLTAPPPLYLTDNELDETGKPVGKAQLYTPSRPAEILFRSMRNSNGIVWKMFSTTITGPQIFATVSNKTVAGTALAGISLTTMSEFMQVAMQRPLFRNGYMYFMNEEGILISVSDVSDQKEVNGSQSISSDLFSGGDNVRAENYSNAYVAAGARFLQGKVGLKGLLEAEQHFCDIKLMNQNFYVDSAPLSFMGLSVVGVILLPRDAVMHKVDRRSHMTLVIILGVAASVLILGCAAVLLFTNRVSTEMELKAELILQLEAKRKAEASSNHKSQFMANMSHELRTPMAGIIGLVDILLSDDSLTSEQMDNVSQIRRCSMALLGLLNNILDLSKVEAGKLGLEKCDFDLGHEVASLVDMFSVQCLSSGVEIALDLSDDFPKLVRGDSARLRQIFANLVSNAIKFTPSGWICVKGWVETPPIVGKKGQPGKDPLSDSVMLHFEVEDTGCGIDPQKWESVFESFVQADASTTRTHGGTGLGLSIVRSLVHMMGGDIGIVPKRSGRGTLIKFFVVLEKVLSPDHPPSSSSARPHEFPDEVILEPVLGAQVVWGMAESLGRQIGARWMLARGFEVHEVGTWPEIVPTIRELLDDNRPCAPEPTTAVEMGRGAGKYNAPTSSGNNCKVSSLRDGGGYTYAAGGEGEGLVLVILDIALLGCTANMGLPGLEAQLAELQELRDRSHIHVAWLLSPSTSKAVRRQLRDKGYTVVANKPVYQSKLLQLLLWLVGANDRFDDASPGGAPKPMVSQGGGIQVAMEDLYTSDLHRSGSDGRAISVHSEEDMSESDPDTDTTTPRKNPCPLICPVDSSDDSDPTNPSSSFSSTSTSATTTTPLTPQPAPTLLLKTPHDNSPHHTASPQGPDPILRNQQQQQPSTGAPFARSASDAWQCVPSTRRAAGKGTGTGSLMDMARAAAASKLQSVAAAASACKRDQDIEAPEDVVGPGQYPLQFEDSQFLRTDSASITSTAPATSTATMAATSSSSSHHHHRLSSTHNRSRSPLTSSPSSSCRTVPASPTPTPTVASSSSGSGSSSAEHNSSDNNIKTSIAVPAVAAASTKPPFGHTGRHRRLNSRPPNDALAGIHILVAEDTPVLRRLAVLMLQKLGATVTAVGDGLEAFTAVTTTSNNKGPKIDLVLMDCQMPKMDGYQATQEIRAAEKSSGKHTPIVALTAHAMASDEERCLAVGMDGYLTKPIDSQLLVSTLLNLLHRLEKSVPQ